MKRETARRSEAEVRAKYPIDDRVAGWFFRVVEVSAGAYLAEATDLWGRVVSRSGGEPESLLELCVVDARAIQATLVAAAPALAQTSATASQSDEQKDLAGILAAAERFLRALDDLDWETFRASWTAEPTVFFPMGDTPNRVAGRVAVEARWRRFFEETRARGLGPPYLNLDPLDLRTERYGDVGLVTFALELTIGGRRLPLQRRTLLFLREQDAWKLTHMHASGASPA